MSEEEQTTVNEAPKSETSPNVLLIVVLIFNTIVMGLIAFLQYQLSKQIQNNPTAQEIVHSYIQEETSNTDQIEKIGETDGKLFPMESFTANLAQGDGPRRYIRLEIVLKFSKASKEDEFNARKPQIRDRIIGLLNSKKPEEILQSEGKKYLKEEIKSSINSFLIDGRVIDVYYVGLQIN